MKICCITGSTAFTRSPSAELSTGTSRQPSTVRPSAATTSSTMSLHLLARSRLARHEKLADRVMALRRKVEAQLGAFRREERMRDLGQHAAAVAERGIRAHRAAVVEVDQNLQALFEDVMRLAVLHVGHKANAAEIMLFGGIVEPLGGRGQRIPTRTRLRRSRRATHRTSLEFWRSSFRSRAVAHFVRPLFADF